MVLQMVEQTVQAKVEGGAAKPLEDMTLDELDEMEDEEDERVLLEYRYVSLSTSPLAGRLTFITAVQKATHG